MSDPIDTHGFIDWLVYVILGLISTVFALWNAYFGNRITKTEMGHKEIKAELARHEANIHAVELAISNRFSVHEKEERDRDAAHSAEVAREFKELRKDVNDGHAAILEKVNQLARDIRKNGNGNGRT